MRCSPMEKEVKLVKKVKRLLRRLGMPRQGPFTSLVSKKVIMKHDQKGFDGTWPNPLKLKDVTLVGTEEHRKYACELGGDEPNYC